MGDRFGSMVIFLGLTPYTDDLASWKVTTPNELLMNRITLLLFLLPVCLIAKDTEWTGASSSDWNDAANWSNGIPESGDNVFLTDQGSAPSNLNIADLEVNTLNLGGIDDGDIANPPADGLVISGNPFSLGGIQSSQPPGNPTGITIQNDVTMTGTASWGLNSRFDLTFTGTFGETDGLGYPFGINNNGDVFLRGTVTTTNGFRANQADLHFFGMQATGIKPTSRDDEGFWNGGFSRFHFELPEGDSFYEYEFDEFTTFRTTSGGQGITVADGVRAIFNGDFFDNGTNKGINVDGNGRLIMNGADNTVDKITATSGYVQLRSGLGATDADANGAELEMSNGTIDLYGNSLTGTSTRNLDYTASSGVYNGGNLINSQLGTLSVLDGDVTDSGSNNNSLHFGGKGDIQLNGDFVQSNNRQIDKTGTGTVILAGEQNSTGTIHVRNGTFVFDYNASNASKIGDSSAMELNGSFTLRGSDSAATDEVVGEIRFGGADQTNSVGHTELRIEAGAGQTASLQFDTFSNAGGQTVNIDPDGNSALKTTTDPNGGSSQIRASGNLGGQITYQQSTFATIDTMGNGDGTYNVLGLGDGSYDVNDFDGAGPNNLVDVSGTQEITETKSFGFLRFNDGSGDTTLNHTTSQNFFGNDDDGNGADMAILVTPNVGSNDVIISGSGSLFGNAVNSTAYVHQNNPDGVLRFDTRLFNFSAGTNLTKTGEGEIILTSDQDPFGNFNIHRGKVTFDKGRGSGNGSPIGIVTDDRAQITLGNGATLNYAGAELVHTDARTLSIDGNATLEVAGVQLDGSTPTGKITYDFNAITFDNGSDHILTLAGAGTGELVDDINLGFGELHKTGSGTWIIAGENGYEGQTLVQEGTLLVEGSTRFFSDVTVEDGATLGGSGTIGGQTVFNGASTLAPGSSPGTLTFQQSLTLAPGTIIEVELGTFSDLIAVEGALTLDGTLNVLAGDGFSLGEDFVIFTFDPEEGITNNELVLGSLPDGVLGEISLNEEIGEVIFTSTPIPEPGFYATLAGIVALGLASYRRRKSRIA